MVFATGNKLTSADVKWCIERTHYMLTTTSMHTDGIESMDCPDDTTLVIKLSAPDSSFLTKLTVNTFAVMDSTVLAENGGLNTENAADQRVYDILSKKFELFEGVFGASDVALGVLESGKAPSLTWPVVWSFAVPFTMPFARSAAASLTVANVGSSEAFCVFWPPTIPASSIAGVTGRPKEAFVT